MNEIKEHDLVVLSEEITEENLEAGDIGTVVHRYENGNRYEVEFATAGGNIVAVLKLSSDKIRPVGDSDIFHARLRRVS